MRTFRLQIGFMVGLLAVIGVAGYWLFDSPDGTLLRERIAGDTPQAKIAAYVQAILGGDEQAALAGCRRGSLAPCGRWACDGHKALNYGFSDRLLELWEPAPLVNPEQAKALSERRRQVTRELYAARAGIQPRFAILHTEWWGTCCEPTVASDSRDAGGARVQVQFMQDGGRPVVYVFDVFVRDLPYWGAAAGYAYRHWVIRDIYPAGGEPYFWRLVYEPRVQYLEWKPAAP